MVIARLEFVLSHALHMHRKHKVVGLSPTSKSFFIFYFSCFPSDLPTDYHSSSLHGA